jgi:hypothetical protein
MKTTEQALRQQQQDAERDRQSAPKQAAVSATVPTAPPSNDAAIDSFLLEHAGGGGATFFRFAKGRYCNRDGEEIAPGKELVAVYDQIQTGWIKFHGKGNTPERQMGPLFGGFVVPRRSEMGDTDESLWEAGPNNEPVDPWQLQVILPLLDAKTSEPYIFGTTSMTGRTAVGKLIFACKQLRKKNPDVYPVVRLDVSGFEHRNPQIGWVPTPAFPVIGQTPKDGTALPDTSLEADLDDSIPF